MNMKVLHVIDSGGLYGAEMMLLALMEEQVRTGIVPVLGSIGGHSSGEKPIEAEARRRGLTVHPFRMTPGPNFAGALDIVRYAIKSGFDLFHSHGYKGDILLGFLPRLVRRLPIVVTVHGWTSTGAADRMFVYEWLDGVSLARMDRVVLVNHAMLEHPRIAGRRGFTVDVVENGVGASFVPAPVVAPQLLSFCATGAVVGGVGRLSREKGFDILLRAAARLLADGHDVKVVIIGDGGGRKELEGIVAQLELENRVFMPGYLPDARRYLHLFTLFAMPSLTEGLPMVLLEAMQEGVPVVASAVGGIPELLADGACGVLTQPGDPESVAQGIERVLDEPKWAVGLARAAQTRVAERYSVEAMAAGYRNVYLKVVGGSGGETPWRNSWR
ncbi:MAG: glycosyltransferase [Geobacter sp.]|nr:MAG: glycosyltransferase [Geobacter sp.]